MAAVGVQTFGEWKQYLDMLNPQLFSTKLDKALLTGMQRIGLDFVALAKDQIVQKKYAANKPFTIAMKGSDTPLIDHGDLIGSIAFSIDSTRSIIVGANKFDEKGRPIAQELHDGKDRRWAPIPPRPFIQEPLDMDETEESITKHTYAAMIKALTGVGP